MEKRSLGVFGLAVVGLAVAAVLLLLALRAESVRQEPPPVTAAPLATPVAAPQEGFVDLDLLAPQTGAPLVLEVPAGEPVNVRITNRAPAVAYRATLERPGDTRVHTTEIREPFESEGRKLDLGPDCSPFQDAWLDVLHVTDEAAVKQAVARLDATIASHPCPALRFVPQQLDEKARPRVHPFLLLKPGEEARVTVVRLDPVTKQPTRTWAALIRGAVPAMAWSYATEEAWLLGETAKEIAATLSYVQTGKIPAVSVTAERIAEGTYRVTTKAAGTPASAPTTIAIATHVWSPATYAPLAAGIANVGPVRSADAKAPPSSAFKSLTAADPNVLVATNERVSRWLAENPRDAAAYESAALVVGRLAMREAAGRFSDTRRLLCRMTAHLALAEALRGSKTPTSDGRLAEVLLETLAARAKPALDRLGRMESAGKLASEERAWVNALRMRNTGDWRIVADPKNATPVEQVEYLRAASTNLGDLFALAALRDLAHQGSVDWSRAVFLGGSTVQPGNTLAGDLLKGEIAEASTIWKRVAAVPVAGADSLIAAVGAACEGSPDQRPSVEAIDPSSWACSFERHILAAVQRMDDHLAQGLGSYEAAQDLRAQASLLSPWKKFGAIQLDQALRPAEPGGHAQIGATEKPCSDVVALLKVNPDALGPRLWDLAYRMCSRQRDSGDLRDPGTWFSPAIPVGTTYDVSTRMLIAGLNKQLDLPRIEAMKALVGYDPVILAMYAGRKYARSMTAAEFGREIGPAAEYNLKALRAWARLAHGDAAVELRLQKRLCGISADDCVPLARTLAKAGNDAEAVTAYRKALDHALNQVAVSWEMDWLVDHYLDTGKNGEAVSVAQAVAEVGSAGGMATQGRLLERLGKFDEAEATYQRIAKAYQDPALLNEFYVRRQVRTSAETTGGDAEKALKAVFPSGLVKTTRETLAAAASRSLVPGALQGVVMGDRDWADQLRGLGVENADLVMAVDGYRVETTEQYLCVLSFADDPMATVLVLRSGKILALQGKLWRLKYGAVRDRA